MLPSPISSDPDRRQRGERSQPGAEQRARDDVEREVHAQVHARERDGGGQAEHPGTEPRADDRDGGGGRERGRAVAGREGRVAWDRHQRIGLVGARAFEEGFQRRDDERGRDHRDGRRGGGDRNAAAPQIGGEADRDQDRAFHPPGRQQHEHRRQHRARGSDVEQGAIHVERRHSFEASSALFLTVNARASGIADPDGTLADALRALRARGHVAAGMVTRDERELWRALDAAAKAGRRVVLFGGDGSLHSAANAPVRRLPELALIPAGRANNIARALGIPTSHDAALALAAEAPARGLDALRVRTPGRIVYALEAVSAGFHAAARAGYTAENSSDLRQGARVLAGAVRRYAPYRVRAAVDGRELASLEAAQLFVANLPYFGFGFHIDPLADPSDGELSAILLEARGRTRLVSQLAATYRGRHRGRRIAGRHVELIHPLPLVADATPLGTTTAAISVAPARLRVAS